MKEMRKKAHFGRSRFLSHWGRRLNAPSLFLPIQNPLSSFFSYVKTILSSPVARVALFLCHGLCGPRRHCHQLCAARPESVRFAGKSFPFARFLLVSALLRSHGHSHESHRTQAHGVAFARGHSFLSCVAALGRGLCAHARFFFFAGHRQRTHADIAESSRVKHRVGSSTHSHAHLRSVRQSHRLVCGTAFGSMGRHGRTADAGA